MATQLWAPCTIVITYYKTAILERNFRSGASTIKQVNLNFLVLDIPVGNLRSSMAVFVPYACVGDHYPAKGPLLLVHLSETWRKW